MNVLKAVDSEELKKIIKEKVIRLDPDGYINIKTQEVIPVHMGKLLYSSSINNSCEYKAFYVEEKKNLIKTIKNEGKLLLYVKGVKKDLRYLTFYLLEPYIRYDNHQDIEFSFNNYEYTDRRGVSLKETKRKKELEERKEKIEKPIRTSITQALKGHKVLSIYNPKTNKKMFSLDRYIFNVYYDALEEVKYVKLNEKLFDGKYSSYLEYKLILDSLPINSKVHIYYKNEIYIKAIVRTVFTESDKSPILKIVSTKNELNKLIKNDDKKITLLHESKIDKIFKFNYVHIELKDHAINFIFDDMGKVRNIKNNKSFNYAKYVSPMCKEYIDEMKMGDSVSVYHNSKKCFSGRITNSFLSGVIYFNITEELDDKKDITKKEKKKWKFNNIKMSVNEDNYYFSYKEINKPASLRYSKVVDLGGDVPEEAKIELMKLSKRHKIVINCLGMYCYELKLDHMLSPTRFAVEIIVDNLDQVIQQKKELDQGNAWQNNNQTEKKHSIQKSKSYVDSFTKVMNRHNIVQGIQLIASHHNHSTIGHNVKDVVGTFAFYDSKRDSYSTFNIVVHYCEKCRRYFEIRSSFELQLKSVGLKLEDVLTGYYNDHMVPITFKHFGLNETSLLGKYGYSVKKGGPSKYERQIIIDYVLENHIMSKSEIKSFIDYLISFNGKKSHMEDAVNKWQQDINYINSLVLKNNIIK